MALTERNRNALYQGLTRTIGDEEAVEAMLSQFPARETDEPVTREYIEAQGLATKDFVRSERIALEDRLTERFASKDFVRAEIAGLEQRLRKDMTDGFAAVVKEVHAEMRSWFVWSYGAMFVLLAAVVTAAKILE